MTKSGHLALSPTTRPTWKSWSMQVPRRLRIALVGGGLGGLTAALALAGNGFEVHVFEQSNKLREAGAGIGLSPNALNVLRALGLDEKVRRGGFVPDAIVGRDWLTSQELFRLPLKGVVDAHFGTINVQVHRGDLLNILAASAADYQIHLDCQCISVASSDHEAILTLSNGHQDAFDVVVGCDGIHSVVRATLHGPETPRFTGNMCWRALIDATKLPPAHIPSDVTSWIGVGGHIVTYYVRGGTLVNVVAIRETALWAEESWSVEAQTSEFVDAFPSVHWTLRMLFEQVDRCFKWGLFDRDPLLEWGKGRITLLGDAAHPMLPFLGQGAARAMEDAYVLARALADRPGDVGAALAAYEAERRPRTAQVQLGARNRSKVLHKARREKKSKGHLRRRVAELSDNDSVDYGMEWLYAYDPTRRTT